MSGEFPDGVKRLAWRLYQTYLFHLRDDANPDAEDLPSSFDDLNAGHQNAWCFVAIEVSREAENEKMEAEDRVEQAEDRADYLRQLIIDIIRS